MKVQLLYNYILQTYGTQNDRNPSYLTGKLGLIIGKIHKVVQQSKKDDVLHFYDIDVGKCLLGEIASKGTSCHRSGKFEKFLPWDKSVRELFMK